MKKATRKEFERKFNKIAKVHGATFEFTTKGNLKSTLAGVFWPHNKTIIVRNNASVDTIAHEIAHAAQFKKWGYTYCESNTNPARNFTNKQLDKIILEHHRLTEALKAKMYLCAMGYDWEEANGTYGRRP